MTTVNIFRKPAEKFANLLTSNESVTEILEDPEQGWVEMSSKLHSVADMTPPDEYGPSTSLGKGEGFMSPFVDSMEIFDSLYSTSDWCRTSRRGLVKMEIDPVSTRTTRIDVSFAEKIEVNPGGRIIVIGDIHSGIHSLVEILDNLLTRGILMDDFKLKRGYKMIFLGDIVDRGGFGLDILNIVFRIKVRNFQDVTILNGNHEDIGTYSRYGFKDEIEAQLPSTEDQEKVHMLLTYLPSVVFVHINNTWIQMNHGGIEPTYDPNDFIQSDYDFEFHGYDNEYDLYHMGLRWNDFNGNLPGIGPSSRGSSIEEFGSDPTNEYLQRNSLTGIIRGHQDTYHCAILKKKNGSNRDMDMIEKVGMLYPEKDHWMDKLGQWEKIGISDTFKDYLVVTTSTATRARDLGYNSYIELTETSDDILSAKKTVHQFFESYENFMKHLGLTEEFNFLVNSNPLVDSLVSDNFHKWDVTINNMKEDDRGSIHYPLLFLNSFGSIVGNI